MATKKFRLLPGSWKSAEEKLKDGIWPWTEGIRGRLPLHYKMRVVQSHMQKPIPVHYRPDERKYKLDKHGQRIRVQNVPIPVIYPREADEGLWGGVGIVQGMKKQKNNPLKPRNAYFWRPKLFKRVLFSEILNKHFEIVVTSRTLNMIDEAYGFDFYILKTHEVDLKSKLGMRLKKEMLLSLARKDLYLNDPAKREEVYDRYKEFILSEEEAEWVGLTLREAEEKQMFVEEQEDELQRKPLKEIYLDDLIYKLDNNLLEEEEESSWLSKLSPWKKENKPDASS